MNKYEMALNAWPVVERLGWAVEKYFSLREAGEVYLALPALRRWFKIEGNEFRCELTMKRGWYYYITRDGAMMTSRRQSPHIAFHPGFEFARLDV